MTIGRCGMKFISLASFLINSFDLRKWNDTRWMIASCVGFPSDRYQQINQLKVNKKNRNSLEKCVGNWLIEVRVE